MLYPKIPKNGITRNVPKKDHDGESFDLYMAKRKEMMNGKKAAVAKKKEAGKVEKHKMISTRSRTARPRRARSSSKMRH
jgi:hypothetical protein